MFSYKVAVAIKNHGYTNIKIYNGGLREWAEEGHEVERVEPLPDYQVKSISSDQLQLKLTEAEKYDCRTSSGGPVLTLLDLRTERIPEGARTPVVIMTSCPTITGLLDDLLREEFRSRLPQDSPVFVVTETGNRDAFAARFLYRHGFINILGLEFGMRGWLKAEYPTLALDAQ